MSVIHLNQIKARVTKVFGGILDLEDIASQRGNQENFVLTRGLAAHAIQFLSTCDVKSAAGAVTDGSDDNGIDAIYYDEKDKRLYLVQAKWIHSGKGEPDSGDVKKFVAGVTDLFNLKFEKFNKKVRSKKKFILQALEDPFSRYSIVLAYTGVNSLATHASNDLETLKKDLNDTSDMVDVVILNQNKLHSSLTVGLLGDPIVIDISLKSWGKVAAPYLAYYGQVTAGQISSWWQQYHNRLFARNLRNILGDTEVNTEIRSSLNSKPDSFWYFNNGITVVAQKVKKTMAHGADTEYGTFHCEDVSIVNGAQTVGTIGRYFENSLNDSTNIFIAVRIISLDGTPATFGEQVTRSNNRQNKIESRDFVTLDPEQNRIKQELAIDGVTYTIARSQFTVQSDKSFDLVDCTTALACASGKPHLIVLAKKEIGKLWEDIGTTPYKELFNQTISGMYIWRCVRIQRMVDQTIHHLQRTSVSSDLEEGVIFHGNRVISAIVFHRIGRSNLECHRYQFESQVTYEVVRSCVEDGAKSLKAIVEAKYRSPVLQNLFKNLTKCKEMMDLCLGARPTMLEPGQISFKFHDS